MLTVERNIGLVPKSKDGRRSEFARVRTNYCIWWGLRPRLQRAIRTSSPVDSGSAWE